MGLRDVTGVFSRFFVVGFFLPVFFSLVVLAQLGSADFQPMNYETADGQTQMLLLGGLALLLALVLSGLAHVLLRLFSGSFLPRPLAKLMIRQARHRYNKLQQIANVVEDDRVDPDALQRRRSAAFWRLKQEFPIRRELYKNFGLRNPTTSADERKMARALNDFLAYGRDLPDDFRVEASKGEKGQDDEGTASPLA
jgi:hypothetical protein